MQLLWGAIFLFVLVIVPLSISNDQHCHDLLCASVVSKCALTESCKCEINRAAAECSCCHNCTACLGADYDKCCSCVGLCDRTSSMSLVRESQVGDIAEPIDTLFRAIASAPDEYNMWTYYTFPIDDTLDEHARKTQRSIRIEVLPQNGVEPVAGGRTQVNCTVMYHSQCISVTKCHDYCSRRGAASYRYFFDGCCECVGLYCLNYGLNESKCAECSQPSEEAGESDVYPGDKNKDNLT
ncbi:protein twisted gastrulation [Hyalella azteca]|uniref:Protein twisted gastrulation n=1 Tax=Hyalella azteca TaxID=294128 RepID=A0A8B7MYQ2_HYAAZ|nr:protein twisted gastrulation [Hyalella azteca]